MGDPRKKRRDYSRPQHLWREERITEEKSLCKRYGLKSAKEVWKFKSKVRDFRKDARKLLSMEEGEKKREEELLSRLRKLGIKVKNLEEVLALKIEDLLDRRLESVVYRKGLANTMKQGRQFITHGHILVGDRVVDIPSYLVPEDEEDKISLKRKIKLAPPQKKKGKKESGKEK